MLRNPFARAAADVPRAVPAGTAVYAIGDIHGRADLLTELHARIVADADRRPVDRRVAVYLGDYVDRGPDTAGVIDLVRQGPGEGFETVALLGNHERLMLEFLEDIGRGPLWLRNGGDATLTSYGVDPLSDTYIDAAALKTLQAGLRERLPGDHLTFLDDLRLAHAEGDYLFVHAGIRPGVPIADQTEADVIWIRDLFLNSTADHGCMVVHGHTIAPEPQLRPNRIGIDTGAYYTEHLTCLALEGTKRQILSTNR
jgi:serine/threonine protein phosphatase 1